MILKNAVYLLTAVLSCDPAPGLLALFTPPRPQLGRYAVCTTTQPLAVVASPGMTIEAVEALNAFGTAGPYDRFAVARLYGGRRVQIARGWTELGGQIEARTLISPYPDATLARLLPGTMIIKFTLARDSTASGRGGNSTPPLLLGASARRSGPSLSLADGRPPLRAPHSQPWHGRGRSRSGRGL